MSDSSYDGYQESAPPKPLGKMTAGKKHSSRVCKKQQQHRIYKKNYHLQKRGTSATRDRDIRRPTLQMKSMAYQMENELSRGDGPACVMKEANAKTKETNTSGPVEEDQQKPPHWKELKKTPQQD